jgi:hypothetical protein
LASEADHPERLDVRDNPVLAILLEVDLPEQSGEPDNPVQAKSRLAVSQAPLAGAQLDVQGLHQERLGELGIQVQARFLEVDHQGRLDGQAILAHRIQDQPDRHLPE